LARVLQQVRGRLRPETDAAALVAGHVNEHTARWLLRDAFERGGELGSAFTAQRAEYVASETARMYAYERVVVIERVSVQKDTVHRHRRHEGRKQTRGTAMTQLACELVRLR